MVAKGSKCFCVYNSAACARKQMVWCCASIPDHSCLDKQVGGVSVVEWCLRFEMVSKVGRGGGGGYCNMNSATNIVL